MTTPPVHPVPSEPVPGPPGTPAVAERLLALARALLEPSDTEPSAQLLGVEGSGPEEAGRLVLAPLTEPDPVVQLVGLVAPPQWWAVGFVGPAHARPLDHPDRPRGRAAGAGCGRRPAPSSTFVHLVARDGTGVGALGRPEGEPLLVGPDDDARPGRLADLCRRALALPTAPPPGDMVPYVIDIWLALVARAAVDRPGLGWGAVVALHPTERLLASVGAPGPPRPSTPAALAGRTCALGATLDWERHRRSCVDHGGTPFGELDGDEVAWMDAGSFARWMLGEMPPWPTLLDLLEGALEPGAHDRLWATLALCPPSPWPPTGP